jgi:three-Cys-motif partner protein
MRQMSEAYHGREQTYLKHQVLVAYLAAWSQKLASIPGRIVDLWYVDVFAGPWSSRSATRDDTSIAISLRALNEAARTWAQDGRRVRLHAVFVEKDPTAFQALEAFVREESGVVHATTLHGQFGDHVDTINRMVGDQAAFIFVDPTGWDGAALRFIAKLGGRDRRDLMINVMYDHINRFKDDERAFLRSQMREFFGIEDDLPPGLNEDGLMDLYRARLKAKSGLRWVADLAVPVPDRERTKFHLVVAGRHPAAIRLFRDIEKRVIGIVASKVRADARARAEEARTGQPALFGAPAPPMDRRYDFNAPQTRPTLARQTRPTRGSRSGSQRWPGPRSLRPAG